MDYNNFIIIVNMAFVPWRVVKFHGAIPDEFTENHSAEFEPVTIKSRSSPLAVYSGSAAVTIDLSIDIHEDYLRAYGPDKNISIVKFVKDIRALTYPRYTTMGVIPPKIFIKVGSFFHMNAYCTSNTITWRKPLRDDRYISAGINLSLTEITKVSHSADTKIV